MNKKIISQQKKTFAVTTSPHLVSLVERFELNKKGNVKNNWSFVKGNIEDNNLLHDVFEKFKP